MGSPWTAVEGFWLQWHVDHGDPGVADRARLLLAEEAATTAEAADTPAERTSFQRQGLALFPAPAIAALACTPHAEYVAALAGMLFDATRSLHHQPPPARAALLAAARLHDLALTANGTAPASAADLLAGVRLADLGRGQQAVLVAALRLAAQPASRAAVRTAERLLKPPQKTQARVMAALLQVADALDEGQNRATRVESITVEPAAVSVRLGGREAAEAARLARRRARLWQPALKAGLHFSVAPLTAADLAGLASASLNAALPLSRAIRRWLAGAQLRWQAALEGAMTDQPAALALAEEATTELRQALAAFQPVLKRKPTRRLRQALGTLEDLLRHATNWQRLSEGLATYQAGQPAGPAANLQPLADATAQAVQQALGTAMAWLQGPDAVELAEALTDFVGVVPLRRKQDAPLGRASAPVLRGAAEAMADQQAAFSAHEPKSLHRVQRAALRCQVWLEVLGGAERFGPGAATLAADLERLARRLDELRRLDAADDAIGAFLDRWAVRQARRKAPQLHGAEAVLAFRQASRSQRRQQQRALPGVWRPVRAQLLQRRVAQLLRESAAG